MPPTSREELLGIGVDPAVEAKENAIARKRATARYLLREKLVHSQQMWKLRHDARVERWTSRATAFGRMLSAIAGNARDGGITLLIGILVLAVVGLLGVVTYDAVVNADPYATEDYYVHKSTLNVHGIKRYAVYRSVAFSDPRITSAATLENAVAEAERLNGLATGDSSYYHSAVSSSTDCWVVKLRVRGNDESASTCYDTFGEAVVERDRLAAITGSAS